MPYQAADPLAASLARKSAEDYPDQVANAPDALATVDLAPVSEARVEATRAGWEPLLYGQAIPRVGERVYAESSTGS